MSAFKRIMLILTTTINDELHHKSVYLFGGAAFLFVFLLRGCYDNDVVVNGEKLNGATIGWHASLIAFHLISIAGVIIGLLLGTRVLRRDQHTGMVTAILSRPVKRVDYIIGKTLGVWTLAYGFTLFLHLAVYGVMLVKTGGRIGFFIPASFMVSLNVLLSILMVMVASRFVPDILATLFGGGIWLVGYISDTMFKVAQTETVKNLLDQVQTGEVGAVALWRIVWPKITMLQYYAVSMIKEMPLRGPGNVPPLLNVVFFIVAAFLLLWWHFSREEVR